MIPREWGAVQSDRRIGGERGLADQGGLGSLWAVSFIISSFEPFYRSHVGEFVVDDHRDEMTSLPRSVATI